MEDLLFERLDRLRPLSGPRDEDYRVPFLVEALESRGFCPDEESRWDAMERHAAVRDVRVNE